MPSRRRGRPGALRTASGRRRHQPAKTGVCALVASRAIALLASALISAAVSARAQDATWLASPGSGDFNTAANWSPAAVPTGTASFDTSSQTNVTFSAAVTTIGGWTFNPGASSYNFTNNQFLHFNGAGIVIDGGSATITNNFELQFLGSSTAGSAAITNNGGLGFINASSAGSATIANNNILEFRETSTAGSATITNNRVLDFRDTSTGGTARFINGAAGFIDLSLLTNAGMTAGSIEGAGTISLGAKNLAVGGNNLSTTFSGVLQDGGVGGGTGGSLTKTGTGTLTLSGSNTYTGATTVDAGTLRAGAANAFAPVQRVHGRRRRHARPQRLQSDHRLARGCRRRQPGIGDTHHRQRQYQHGLRGRDRRVGRADQDRDRHTDAVGHQHLYRRDHGRCRHAPGERIDRVLDHHQQRYSAIPRHQHGRQRHHHQQLHSAIRRHQHGRQRRHHQQLPSGLPRHRHGRQRHHHQQRQCAILQRQHGRQRRHHQQP